MDSTLDSTLDSTFIFFVIRTQELRPDEVTYVLGVRYGVKEDAEADAPFKANTLGKKWINHAMVC